MKNLFHLKRTHLGALIFKGCTIYTHQHDFMGRHGAVLACLLALVCMIHNRSVVSLNPIKDPRVFCFLEQETKPSLLITC